MEKSTFSQTIITTDVIKKICVQLGYYRNPVCNEKLYLHRKGFDAIEDDAFTPYTDVKVLWLESNALSHISCGRDSRCIAVKPPGEQGEDAGVGEVNRAKLIATCGNSKSAYVDCCADWAAASYQKVERGWSVDDALHTALTTATDTTNDTDNVCKNQTAGVAEESIKTPVGEVEIVKDVFQSLYPTLRELYLHNNLLREMPDLSGFHRLDTVNLSNNFLQSVRAHCDEFITKAARHEELRQERVKKLLANSKSMQNELRAKVAEENKILHEKHRQEDGGAEGEGVKRETESPQRPQQEPQPQHEQHNTLRPEEEQGGKRDLVKVRSPAEVDTWGPTPPSEASTISVTTTDAPVTVSPTHTLTTTTTADVLSGQETLEVWRSRVIAYSQFCSHTPLKIAEDGKICDDIPDEHRNPCSSLRVLNLSGNRLHHAADLLALLCHHNLAVLDLSHNQLENGEAVLLVLERLPRLRSLCLSGNPLVRTLPRYRKTVLARCAELMHLDDRPVFAAERRLVTAWAQGGEEAERLERMQMRREAESEHIRRLEDFRAMVRRSRHLSDGNGENAGDGNYNQNGQRNSSSSLNNSNVSDTGNNGGSASVRTQTDLVTTETREARSMSEEARERGRVFLSDNYNDDDDEPTSSENSENDNGYVGTDNDNIPTMNHDQFQNDDELNPPPRVRYSTTQGHRPQEEQHESDDEEVSAIYIPLGADR